MDIDNIEEMGDFDWADNNDEVRIPLEGKFYDEWFSPNTPYLYDHTKLHTDKRHKRNYGGRSKFGYSWDYGTIRFVDHERGFVWIDAIMKDGTVEGTYKTMLIDDVIEYLE
jgi:hypothetical protein